MKAARPHPRWLCLAALMGAVGVALGAFGAHGLKHLLSQEQLALWHTAVNYWFWHALAVLVLALSPVPVAVVRRSAGAWVLGAVVFSGSLGALALGAPKALGLLTPLGGLAFILGWLLLALWAWRQA